MLFHSRKRRTQKSYGQERLRLGKWAETQAHPTQQVTKVCRARRRTWPPGTVDLRWPLPDQPMEVPFAGLRILLKTKPKARSPHPSHHVQPRPPKLWRQTTAEAVMSRPALIRRVELQSTRQILDKGEESLYKAGPREQAGPPVRRKSPVCRKKRRLPPAKSTSRPLSTA